MDASSLGLACFGNACADAAAGREAEIAEVDPNECATVEAVDKQAWMI